jgi:hypothetical protein
MRATRRAVSRRRRNPRAGGRRARTSRPARSPRVSASWGACWVDGMILDKNDRDAEKYRPFRIPGRRGG